jgi:hypothetical protein
LLRVAEHDSLSFQHFLHTLEDEWNPSFPPS